MPYRTPPGEPVTRPLASRFAFRIARIRVGVERFELSFWDSMPALWAAMLAATVPFIGGRSAWWSLTALIVVCATARVELIVARDKSHVCHRVLGIVWRRQTLGSKPTVVSGLGWDWGEIAVLPSDPTLRPPLHDHERAVLSEWSFDDAARDGDAAVLASLANAQIARLHGV